MALDYENLLYACASCNLIKSSQRVPDPTAVLLAPDVRVTDDGVLHADTTAAGRAIKILDLNRPRLREYRALWIGIIRLASATDPALYQRLMGFPDDLPNLKRLRPPRGNSRSEGISDSHFARRQANTLAATY